MKFIITPEILTVVNDVGEELNVPTYPSEYSVLSQVGGSLHGMQVEQDLTVHSFILYTKQDIEEAVFNLISAARFVTRRNGIEIPQWLK